VINDAAYWISFAHAKKIKTFRLNELVHTIYLQNRIGLREFYEMDEKDWKSLFSLTNNEIQSILETKRELANNAFLAEDLFNQGYELMPIISHDYPIRLRKNLTINNKIFAPSVIYIKGDKQIFQEKFIAIVGSRNATEKSLSFTDVVVKNATKEYKVIVSGFAKGVDRKALDSSLINLGRSIIVLPQGIMTFTGYQLYYKDIVGGNVLVCSTFHPKSPWSVECAMARNPIIYALADEIYVAESSEKGGTWSGAIDGLRKGRIIYVRRSNKDEKNANNILIQKGALPVDFDGNEIVIPSNQISNQALFVKEPKENEHLEDKIKKILYEKESQTSRQIQNELQLDWLLKKLTKYLHTLSFIEINKNKNKNIYSLKRNQKNFFD